MEEQEVRRIARNIADNSTPVHANNTSLSADDHTIYSLATGARNFTGIVRVNEVAADPTAASLTSGANAKDRLGFYMKNDKLVFAYNNAGTVTYVKLALDGSATTLVHDTNAP